MYLTCVYDYELRYWFYGNHVFIFIVLFLFFLFKYLFLLLFCVCLLWPE